MGRNWSGNPDLVGSATINSNMLTWPVSGLDQGTSPSFEATTPSIASPLTPNPLFPSPLPFGNMFHTPTSNSGVSVVQLPKAPGPYSQPGGAPTVTSMSANPSHLLAMAHQPTAIDMDATNISPLGSKPANNQSEVQKEKTQKGKAKASGVMMESSNNLLLQLSSILPEAIPSIIPNAPVSRRRHAD